MPVMNARFMVANDSAPDTDRWAYHRSMSPEPLAVLVVDDKRPVLDELVYLLERDDRIGAVAQTTSGAEALRIIERGDVDAVFLDIAMPGLSGLDIARLLDKFKAPPHIVFVTAHDQHAIDAFDINAVDYLLKPIREERLSESVRRLTSIEEPDDDERIPVELGGVTRFVRRSSIALAEAQGDYVRLHTTEGTNHLLRSPLTTLADSWRDAGFVRVHRSHMVNLRHVREVRSETGRTTVVLDLGDDVIEVDVARRHARELRERLT